jgi:hypothetical protein
MQDTVQRGELSSCLIQIRFKVPPVFAKGQNAPAMRPLCPARIITSSSPPSSPPHTSQPWLPRVFCRWCAWRCSQRLSARRAAHTVSFLPLLRFSGATARALGQRSSACSEPTTSAQQESLFGPTSGSQRGPSDAYSPIAVASPTTSRNERLQLPLSSPLREQQQQRDGGLRMLALCPKPLSLLLSLLPLLPQHSACPPQPGRTTPPPWPTCSPRVA